MKRIIVSRTDKIGDLLLSIPSFYMVKKMYPNAELVVMVRNYNYEIVKNLPYIDRIIKIDDFSQKDLLNKIGMYSADAFIALYDDPYISKLAKNSGAPIRIAPYSKPSSFLAYNHGVWQKRSKSIKNEAEYNLDLIRKLDPKLFDEKFEINSEIVLGKENILAGDTFFKEYNITSKTLVVNPFMGGSAKNIKDSDYVDIIKGFVIKNPDKNVIIICHIDEEERANKMISEINMPKVYLYANGGGLLNIGAVIQKADVYLGASTGPTHMAGALGKKIVAIYPNLATQSPTRWGVYNNENVKYLIPDKDNKKENYKNPYFDTYDEHMKKLIIKYIEESFEGGGKD